MSTPKRPDALEDASTVRAAATVTELSRSAASPVPAQAVAVGTTLAGRFAIERELGAGGMGVVFVARDLTHELPVALKTLRRLGATELAMFKNEFRALADLHHPNLVQLYELVSDGEQWAFTMELLPGASDFLSYVRPGGQLDEERLRAALQQLAAGLVALHGAGKVHRDLKPRNVLVTDDGRTVVLDFGVIADVAGRLTRPSGDIVGTPHYMAPEQATGLAPGPPADWYAVGVMLYEALTGRLPLTGQPLELLVLKQSQDPPSPRELGIECPEDLEQLAMALLRREPRDRPGDADVQALLGVTRSRIALPRSDGGRFVGRDQELALLEHELARSRNGTRTVIVAGEPGIGKSTLVQHFLERASAGGGALVLAGRCYEREQVPYKAIDALIDALAAWLRELSADEARALLPDEAALLVRLFPVLSCVAALDPRRAGAGDDGADALPPLRLRARAFAALGALFGRIAEKPLVLAIDDLQWTDEDSLALLSELLTCAAAPRLLLVVTVRTARPFAGGSPVALQSVPGGAARAQALGALGLPELLGTLPGELHVLPLGPLPDQPLGHGHPLFMQQLARHAAEISDADCVPSRLETVVLARADRLPAAQRRLLEILAVAGAPTPQRAVRWLLDLDVSEFRAQIGALRSGAWVRTLGVTDDDSIELYHDRIRETLLEPIAPADRRAVHLELARALDEDAAQYPEALVHHLEAAGEGPRAARRAERAAARATRALAFERAAHFLRIALRLGAPDPAHRRELVLALADALANCGRGVEAAELFLEAARGQDDEERLRCERQAAEHLVGSGHVLRGLEILRGVMAMLGEQLPGSSGAALAALLYCRASIAVRGLGGLRAATSDAPLEPRTRLRLEVYEFASLLLGLNDLILGALFQARGLLLALRAGDRFYAGRALAMEVGYLAVLGKQRQAEALLAEVHRLRSEAADPRLEPIAMLAEGAVNFYAGKFTASYELFARATELYLGQQQGRPWFLHNMRIFELFALYFNGDWNQLSRSTEEHLRDAMRRDDRYAIVTFNRAFAITHLVRDDPAAALAAIERKDWQPPPGIYHYQHWADLIARGDIALYDGSAGHVYASLQPRFDEYLRSLWKQVPTMLAQTLWLWGRLALAAATSLDPMIGPASRNKLFATVARMHEKLGAKQSSYAQVFAALLRAGLAARSDRDLDRARSELARAAELAEHGDMKMFAAAARHRLGSLPGASEEDRQRAAAAEEIMRGEHIRNPRRMLAILAPGLPG